MTTDSDEHIPAHRDSVVSLTRQDLAACVDAYRLGSHGPGIWRPGLGVFGGLALGATLVTLGGFLNWSAWLQPTFFGLGWAIALGSLVVVLKRIAQLRREWQWACPQCGAEMIASGGLNPLARAEVAIASGRCPSCGESLFTNEG